MPIQSFGNGAGTVAVAGSHGAKAGGRFSRTGWRHFRFRRPSDLGGTVVDGELGPGDRARLVRSEEEHGIRNVRGL